MSRFSSQAAVDTTMTDAYLDGLKDGRQWDLIGYDGNAAKAAEDDGWDEATINAVGSAKCAALWGCATAEGEEWEAACAAYNAGVKAAISNRAVRYECVGSVRGSCGHEHKTMRAAVRCLDKDRDGCSSCGGGAYSDRRVRRVGDVPLSDREHEEYDAIRESLEEGS